MEDNKEVVVTKEETVVVDSAVTELEEKLAKMTEERDNYKIGLLRSKGKLDGDEGKNIDVSDLSVAEQVELALKNREIEQTLAAKETEVKRILKENSELKLALKNRPQDSIGGGGNSSSIEVKDNVFSVEQIAAIKAKAKSAGLDPDKFLERFKNTIKTNSNK